MARTFPTNLSPIDAYAAWKEARPLAYFEWAMPAVMDSNGKLVHLKVTDASLISSGYNQGLYIDYTSSGAKTGGEVHGLAIDLTISAALTGYAYGIALYTAQSGNPNFDWMSALSIYAANCGSGTVSAYVVIDVGKESTNQASSRDAFMRFRTHAGTTHSVFLIEGSNMASYLFNWSDGVGTPHESGDITSGKACSGGLRCLINGTVGVIPLYAD